MRRGFWSMDHISAVWNMSFGSQRSKSSMAKLTLYKVIILARNHWYLRHISSFFQNFLNFPIVFHHLLQWLRLFLPFGNINIFILLLYLSCVLLWNLFRRSCFWLSFHLLYLVRQSMILHFKDFSLFTDFCTSIFMFFYSVRSKLSSALTARNSTILIDFNRTFFRLLNRRSHLWFLLFNESLTILSTWSVFLFKTGRNNFYGSFLLNFFRHFIRLLFERRRFIYFSLSS